MRFIKYLIVTLVAVLAFQPLHADGENYKEQLRKQPKTLHYTDTIRSSREGPGSGETSQAPQYRHTTPQRGG